jgi:hypothetical protein
VPGRIECRSTLKGPNGTSDREFGNQSIDPSDKLRLFVVVNRRPQLEDPAFPTCIRFSHVPAYARLLLVPSAGPDAAVRSLKDPGTPGALRGAEGRPRRGLAPAFLGSGGRCEPDFPYQPQIERGPDGFPYFQLAIPAGGAFTPFSLSHVLPYVLEHGLGAVVYGEATRVNPPEWVFSFGALLGLQMFGTLDTEGTQDAALSGGAVVSETLETPRQILSGMPSEEFLPASARRALGRYLRADPGVALIVDPCFGRSKISCST